MISQEKKTLIHVFFYNRCILDLVACRLITLLLYSCPLFILANSVRIVFSDNGTDRTLKIGKGVRATLNCSLVALSLQDQAVAPQSIATNWTLRKFDRQNILSADPLPVTLDDVE